MVKPIKQFKSVTVLYDKLNKRYNSLLVMRQSLRCNNQLIDANTNKEKYNQIQTRYNKGKYNHHFETEQHDCIMEVDHGSSKVVFLTSKRSKYVT